MAVNIINSNKKIKFDCVDTWRGSSNMKNMPCVINDTMYDTFITNMKPVTGYYNDIKRNTNSTECETYKNFEHILVLKKDFDRVIFEKNNDMELLKKQRLIEYVNKKGLPKRNDIYEKYENWKIGKYYETLKRKIDSINCETYNFFEYIL